MSKAMDEIRALKVQLDEKIKSEGKSALKEDFTAMFDAVPELEAVRWRQYTPYFNDGDACEFGVREFEYKLTGFEVCNEDDDKDDDSRFVDAWTLTYQLREKKDGSVTKAKLLLKRIKAVAPEQDEDVFLAVFGDHAEIVATREGFQVEEYSHD